MLESIILKSLVRLSHNKLQLLESPGSNWIKSILLQPPAIKSMLGDVKVKENSAEIKSFL